MTRSMFGWSHSQCRFGFHRWQTKTNTFGERVSTCQVCGRHDYLGLPRPTPFPPSF